jgi:hypothetical protein
LENGDKLGKKETLPIPNLNGHAFECPPVRRRPSLQRCMEVFFCNGGIKPSGPLQGAGGTLLIGVFSGILHLEKLFVTPHRIPVHVRYADYQKQEDYSEPASELPLE